MSLSFFSLIESMITFVRLSNQLVEFSLLVSRRYPKSLEIVHVLNAQWDQQGPSKVLLAYFLKIAVARQK